jgi:Protein kinase domain/Leucine Rich repeat
MSDITIPSADPHAAHRRPLPEGAPNAVGRYDVLRLLGEGTFGRVYLAHDPQLSRYVALKLPREQLPFDAHEKFLREAKASADIYHPNVCPVYDVGVHDKTPYIVMRCVGSTLDQVLSGEPLDGPTAIGFALQIAKGLEAAHAKGIVHRDLKPGNVLYDATADQLLLTDFGIARWLDGTASTTGGLKGNPAHMAPEQWDPQFGDVSARTDVYSLGVLLFRMLTGVPLFTGGVAELMRAHCDKPPRRPTDVRPDLDPRCDAVCVRALAKEPEKRFGSATEFAAALAALLAPPPSNAGGTKWTVGVPGMWYARGAGAPRGAKWDISTPTPGPVPCETGRVYRLEASPQADDRDLAALSFLKGFPALHRLDLNGCEQLTDSALTAVGNLTTLRTLHLRWCKNLTDAGLAAVAPLAELAALDLRGCKEITDAGAKHLRAFPKLEALDVMFCNKLTDAALSHFASLRALRTLNLSECFRVTDEGLTALAPLTELRVLHLNWCMALTNAGLSALAALPSLAELSVQGCPHLTDAGLEALTKLPNLRWLHVGACDGITQAGRDALQRAMPRLKLER